MRVFKVVSRVSQSEIGKKSTGRAAAVAARSFNANNTLHTVYTFHAPRLKGHQNHR